MPTCPNGHQSGADDWCEVCGHRMAGAGAVPPPPPPPPPAPGYGYPGPAGGDPNATQQAELCPQCRTPREATAAFCEECRWNFVTNTATSYTPVSPPPPARSGGGLNLPPGFTSAPRPPDPYEYQGSRPSQVNRPAEPLPPEPDQGPPPPPPAAGGPSFGAGASGPGQAGGPGQAPPPGSPHHPFGPGPGGPDGPDRRGPGGPGGPDGRDPGSMGPGPGPGGPGGPGGTGGANGPGGPGGPGHAGPAQHGGPVFPPPPPPPGPGHGRDPGGRGNSPFAPPAPPAPGAGPATGQGPGHGTGPDRPSFGNPPPPPGGGPAFGPGPGAQGPGGGPAFGQGPGHTGDRDGGQHGHGPSGLRQAAPGQTGAVPAPPRGFRQPGPAGDDDWVLPPPSAARPPQGPPPHTQPPHAQPPHTQQPQAQQAPHEHQPPQGQQPPLGQQPAHGAAGTGWTLVVRPDRDYFTAMMRRSGPEAASLNLPAYAPERRVSLTGDQVSVGRRRQSTGEAPDIDLAVPPEDPGVSHQHALFVRQQDGSWAVMDQNSTNGTTLNGADDPIQPYVPVPLADGDRVHVGAWTTLTVVRG
ncbi:FHA domain-containing protein [Streptomyces sp. DH12]|uniref:FHA domain-containing protein n=1 Tax=Streptomyces sp. DH12 TaxID=2857010 RepID=UPI001E380588|nr:FHA domain-containing protein [Streptomyces sp. DH12]